MKRSGLFLIAVLLSPVTARAEVVQSGPNSWSAGVRTDEFDFVAAQQRQPNWCWAACIQMVLNYHGLHVTQEQVVARVFGGLVDAPGQPQQILAALSGWAPDNRGRYSAIIANTYVMQGSDLVNDLAYKWPIIVGLRRDGLIDHAYVLTAVHYTVDARNQPIFHRVTLRDPWPGNPSRIEMSWNEFNSRLIFLARVYVNRL